MQSSEMVFTRWDDVVFENRNKLYGAYSLRRNYPERVVTGSGITFCFVVLLLSLQFLPGDQSIPGIPTVPDGGIKFDWNPSLAEKLKERQTKKASRRKGMTNNPLAVREAVPVSDSTVVGELVTQANESGEEGIGEITSGTDLSGAIPVIDPPVNKVFDHAEVMPGYTGGQDAMMRFIRKKIRYPRSAQEQKIDGTVFVRFVVRGDGTLTDVEVIKGIHPDCDREAVRVIRLMDSWKGGSQNGTPVSVRLVLPIRFSLGPK